MHGQFHKELSLIKDDSGGVIGVAVSGPITWDGEVSATIHVTISQGLATAGGVTGADVTHEESVWALAALVEGDEGFAAGPATADAVAVVRSPDGRIRSVPWSSPPDPSEITLR
jgi:hypothetical protein